jgi:large subunit ribosomal protein L29
MKAKDMREKSLEDLRELEKSLSQDAFQAKFKNFTNRLDDSSQLQKLRRDLARVKTLLSGMQRAKEEDAGAKSPTPAPQVGANPKAPSKPPKAESHAAKSAQNEATK